MSGWSTIDEIPQLKWQLLASGNPAMNESELAICILDILITLCEYYPSYDRDGAIIRPFPRAKKFISHSSCLPHVVQLLLTYEPSIIERVSNLLFLVLQENPQVNQVFRTGLFFFILMFSGSNLLPVGRLLHATHILNGHTIEDNLQAKQKHTKSFLSYLLPEAMVCYLENHGPEKFVQIFLGEFDTPEAIWNGEMRRYLIERIACHVSDFTRRLKSNNRATYDYCPIAPINYSQLEDELFVDIYYLRNLCNTDKFPNWPIKDPLGLLKSLLDSWKEEVERKPSNLNYQDALKTLGFPHQNENINLPTPEELAKAYHTLALEFHPDRNPDGGREKFEQVHRAYKFLSSKQAREQAAGVSPRNIILILKAQSILFERCQEQLHPYKYSGYPMLIKTIKDEINDEKLFSKPDPLLAYACETTYYTFKCSSKNAEELRRENGLETLQEALSRCTSVLSQSSKSDDVCVQMCKHIVNCFTVATEFEASQQKLSQLERIIKDLNRIFYLCMNNPLTLELCVVSAECAAAFAHCPPLHQQIYESGLLFSLILTLFRYDFTLEESGIDVSIRNDEVGGESQGQKHNKQQMTNKLSQTSLLACVRLQSCCENPRLFQHSLQALLTPFLANKLNLARQLSLGKQKQQQKTATNVKIDFDCEWAHEILKTLNSNVEIPYLIWNNATRAELIDYLETQQRELIRSGECPDTSYGAQFEFDVYKNELIVGDIFIRVYNQQPTFPLTNANEFVQSLIDFIGSQVQYIYSALSLPLSSQEQRTPDQDHSSAASKFSSNFRPQDVQDCLLALSQAVKCNPGIESKCIGHFKLLFSLLKIDQLPSVQDYALMCIQNITGNRDCVADVANSEVLVYLLMFLYSVSISGQNQTQALGQNQDQNKAGDNRIKNGRIVAVLDTLLPLVSNAKLVKEILVRGGLVYLVDIFCNSHNPVARVKAAELISRITYDKLSGFQACLLLNKFLPVIFVDAMKDSSSNALNLFDNNQENPELMWNESIRSHVKMSIAKLAEEIYANQSNDPTWCWQIPNDLNLLKSFDENELIIAGVYLRLFNKNPTWVLRRPKEFLTELMNRFQTLIKTLPSNLNNIMTPNSNVGANQDSNTNDAVNEMEIVTSAIRNLLSSQPALIELVPAMGHIHSVINAINSTSQQQNSASGCTSELISNVCLTVLGELALSRACVDMMSSHDSLLREIKAAITTHPESVDLACFTLRRMYEFSQFNDRLVQQALEADFVTYLLRILESNQAHAQTRALIVKILKSMTLNLVYGPQIETVLSKSKIWSDYSDQKHDLFITSDPSVQAITGPTANVAGYLTAGPASAVSPPPSAATTLRDGSTDLASSTGVSVVGTVTSVPSEPPPINQY